MRLSPAFFAVFVVLGVLFRMNPQWDIEFSKLFYTPEGRFYMADDWWAAAVFRGVHIATVVLVVVLLISLTVGIIRKKDKVFGVARKSFGYMLSVLVLGPGLVVNVILKDGVGRARPRSVTEFGGDSIFTPAFTMSDQDGLSFVSGHAAFGFYWIVLAFLATSKKWKINFTIFALVLGGGVGLVRIMQGGHFLSDVVFSFFFVNIVAATVYYVMYEY